MTEQATMTPLSSRLEESKARILQRDFRGAWEMLSALKGDMEGATLMEQEETFYQMGVCMSGLERHGDAINFLSRAARLAEVAGDASAQARASEDLGGAVHARGDARQAELFYARAHELFSELKDEAGVARGLRNLGGVRVDLGHTTAALADFNAAREKFSALGDTEGVASCVTNLSLLTYRHKGRAAAIEDYKSHLEKGDANHHQVHNNLGFLQLLEMQLGPAREQLTAGIQDCQTRQISDDNLGLLYLNLGVVDALESKWDAAQENLDKAAAIFVHFPVGRAVLVTLLPPQAEGDGMARFSVAEDGHKLAVTFLNSAMVALGRGQEDEALKLAGKALELDKEQGYPHMVLGWILKVKGDAQGAAAAFKRGLLREPQNADIKKSLDVTNPYLTQKIGRNDPCPCGSGKKFKKCHGAG